MALHEGRCHSPAKAKMVVEMLTYLYNLAKGWDMLPEGCGDPCESIPMDPMHRRERFLTDAEFARHGQVLDEVSGTCGQFPAGTVATI